MVTRAHLVLYKQYTALTVLMLMALAAASAPAAAKTPGKTYCFLGYCHRVLTLSETQAEVGKTAHLAASNYDDCTRDRFNPCGLTSSGAVFHADRADNAASPIYPDGTIILVRHPKTQKTAVLRVNSAGPYHGKRLLDVSKAAAEVLGFKRQGVATLEVRILQAPDKAESSYRKNRVYPAVPGYLGAFASLDDAGQRYATLTATPIEVAAIYPQTTAAAPQPQQSIASNGMEQTWLAKAVTFKPGRLEAKLNQRTSAKLSHLQQKANRRKPVRLG